MPVAGGIRIGQALLCFRQVGPKKVGYLCKRAHCDEGDKVSSMTAAQLAFFAAEINAVGHQR